MMSPKCIIAFGTHHVCCLFSQPDREAAATGLDIFGGDRAAKKIEDEIDKVKTEAVSLTLMRAVALIKLIKDMLLCRFVDPRQKQYISHESGQTLGVVHYFST